MINIDSKLANIQKYMEEGELNLKRELLEKIKTLQNERDKIDKTCDDNIKKAEREAQQNRQKIQELCWKAEELINSIERRLYYKQQGNFVMSGIPPHNTPETIFRDLEAEVKYFNETRLPMPLRQLCDSVSVVFNEDYKQKDVNRIVKHYAELQSFLRSNTIEEEFNQKRERLEQERLQKVAVIDDKIDKMISQSVERYTIELTRYIFR